ncbi:MAG: glycosyltransferase family 4 protein [Bryobacteraceae bacterium]
MRVALDATPLTLSSGGLRRYVVELSRALAENFPEDEYWLLSDQSFCAPEAAPGNLRAMPGASGWLERRWWLAGLPRRLKQIQANLFHGANFEVPYLGRIPAVLTLHDLSPWLDPRWQSGAGRVRRRTPWLLRLGRAALVITHTEAVRREATERFHIPPSQIVAVPLAASPRFRPVPAPAGSPYFLYVGTLEPRKNLVMLLDAFREVRRSSPVELVLVGRKRSDFGELPAADGIRWLGELPDERLPPLYSGALAVVYPSLYEGFGLPVLEAMQCGAPVIASRDGAIMEVAGDAALLLDARDGRAWAEAMRLVIERPDRRAELRERSLARASGFSWTQTAQRTREVYVEALRRARR